MPPSQNKNVIDAYNEKNIEDVRKILQKVSKFAK